ncbi:MAG: MotA/TolQ/ExbB proton channel family protein [Salinisphaera sp.]|nr:MotA/TolQ/ExbB proton channel family protein [Salinisphaera sp.]
MPAPPYRLFQQWLVLAGAVAFCATLAWTIGILPELIRGDTTRITLGILVVFLVTSVHCAVRSLALSRETAEFQRIGESSDLGLDERGHLTLGQETLPLTPVTDYLAGVLAAVTRHGAASPEQSQLTDVLNERLRPGHEFGWFICGVLVKLGMLGTVIGFVMMLGAVEITPSFDLATVQRMLGAMSAGMAVALYTTIAGMITSMILGLEYLLLDRAADDLIAQTVVFAERRLVG